MSLSKFNYKSMIDLPPAVRENPHIPFVSKAKKVETPDEAADKTEHIRLEFFMDPSNPASRYSRHFMIFKDGGAEDWIKWLMGYREVENLIEIRELANKSKMIQTLLKDRLYPTLNII
jgi:hypothetical protein